jgi:alpha,alpha-trehalase
MMIHLILPEILYKPLFQDAALSGLVSDGKSLADAVPRYEPSIINANYASEKNKPDFDLLSFLEDHFEIPIIKESNFQTNPTDSAISHVERLWTFLRREPDQDSQGTLIPLPYPYIVPGGRFNEIYYWDSYFTMLGLKVSGHTDMIRSMVDNFNYLIHAVGFIPNGNRTYFLSRSQPPFFSMMVELLAETEGNAVYLKYLDSMAKEYSFWVNDHMNKNTVSAHNVSLPNGDILQRYHDGSPTPRSEMFAADAHLAKQTNRDETDLFQNIRAACESGWDFSSRWFADGEHLSTIQTADILPVDLNCLLYHLESTLAKAYQYDGKSSDAESFSTRAEKRKTLILKYFWNEEKGYFFDYNFRKNQQTLSIHAAGIFPLCFGMVDGNVAKRTLDYLKTHLLKDGGIITTNVFSGQQWDAPNGWAPLQWMAYIAAKNYNNMALAQTIAQRWTSLNEKVLHQTAKMMEKYNVADIDSESGGGEYPVQDGFGWTNGVYLALEAEIDKQETLGGESL